MKNKKTRKKKKKVEDIEFDKINKKINKFILVIIIFYLLNNLVMYFSDTYSYFFIKNILNPVNGFFYYLNGHIDYLSYIISIIFYVYAIFLFLFGIIIRYRPKKVSIDETKLINKLYRYLVVFIFILIIPNYFMQFENHLPHFDNIMFKETQNKTYKKEDLIKLDKYLQEKMLTLGPTFERDENGTIISDMDYNKEAVKNLKNISNDIPLLKGLYPTRSSSINDFIRGFVGSRTTGFTTPYNTYFDFSSETTSIINTVTHEFCHTKGLTRENETVYCAFYAGIKSDNEVSQYAAYLEAFSWLSAALFEIDAKTADMLEDEVLSKCLTSNYNEFCDVYTKNINSYIKGAKELYISSYYLKNYVGYEKELEDSLKILEENGAKFRIGEANVSVSDIMKNVKEDADFRAYITLKLNKKTFNKIKDAISDKRLYLSVYQINSEDKDSKEKLDNPEKYYLAPFKDKDEYIFFNIKYGSVEYEYSRVARLLLEHYDKYGYE